MQPAQFARPAAPVAAPVPVPVAAPLTEWQKAAAAQVKVYTQDEKFEQVGVYHAELTHAEVKKTEAGKTIALWKFFIHEGPGDTKGKELTYLRVKGTDAKAEAFYFQDVKAFALVLCGVDPNVLTQAPEHLAYAAERIEDVMAKGLCTRALNEDGSVAAPGAVIEIHVTKKPLKSDPTKIFTATSPIRRLA